MRGHLLAAALLLALAACVPQRVATARLGEAPAVAGGVFHPGGSTLVIAAELHETPEGRMICGAWVGDGPEARDYAYQVLGAGIVFVGGRRVLQNIGFMAQERGPLGPGAFAGCAAVAGPPGPVTLRLPRMIVNRDCDDWGGCDITSFRQIR
ncbi:hypothetical protein LNKW23_35370 [Paralimibaculum aggregatum]|uniref:Lipoprotein n=1 Tax=Paralimibaculum aggregatum TaxID=3036245 RepID=A0ABQ6LQM1_9RHOB|nr:hypothetical protein [Limibaculum sp. NKW23]GMG84322.1 hypothetical protein LNKW23_35370 [Limibaculum sp. NKW23]